MSLTKPSDYKGTVNIAQDKYDRAALQDYLDELESSYLEDLLGCDLYALFVADLDVNNVPQTARFLTIYNKFCFDIDNCCFIDQLWLFNYTNYYCNNGQNKSRGMVEMLKGFLYFDYIRDQQITNSSIGANKSKGVASDLVSNKSTAMVRAYNKSILDYWNIQYYLKDNEDVYPEFNGIIKESISIL